MKKLDNFVSCLAVLQKANFDLAGKDEIYRKGVLGQFNLVFELAWKTLQEVLRLHGAEVSGSPREVLQKGYQYGFVNDEQIWLLMLKKRNTLVHIYDEEEADEVIALIKGNFLPAMEILVDTLKKKLAEVIWLAQINMDRKRSGYSRGGNSTYYRRSVLLYCFF